MNSPEILRGPLFRRNLHVSVTVKADESMQLAQLEQALEAYEQLTVVFCNRKRACEELCLRMGARLRGRECSAFHGGLTA